MPTLPFDSAHLLLRDAIHGQRHAGYERTISLRNDYLTITTGRDYERFLSRFVQRENEAEYQQRLDLTHQNLSSTASPLIKKVTQISRIQDIKKGLNFTGTSERDQRDLLDVLNDFGGEGQARRGSLDDYLSEYDRISQYDPNAFYLLDFAPFNAARGERARPYAVLIECPAVLNYRYTRGTLDYLITWVNVSYLNSEKVPQVATDYILHAGPYILRYYEVGDGRADLPTTTDQWEAASKKTYRIQVFNPNIDVVPAVRLGDLPDPETAGLTCVSRLFHATIDQFKELINLKSQNDIVSRKHGFPRRYERAPLCRGEEIEGGMRAGCNEGKNTVTGQTCRQCGGSGFEVHRSEQDVVRLGLRGDEMAEDLFDLSKLAYVEKPELETIKAFDEKINAKQLEIYITAFSTDQQVQVTGPAKTATEYTVSREDQNNTLLPIADHKSTIYKFLVNGIVKLMRISGLVESLYEFPRDLKLSGLKELIANLTEARAADVGPELIIQTKDDMIRKQYESDPVALKWYFIKKQHLPYIGLSDDQIQAAYAAGLLLPTMVFLHYNSDIVFGELEIEIPLFIDLPYIERDKLVSAKVEALQARMPKPATMNIEVEV